MDAGRAIWQVAANGARAAKNDVASD